MINSKLKKDLDIIEKIPVGRMTDQSKAEQELREKIASKLRIYEAGLRDITNNRKLNTTQVIVREEMARMEFITWLFVLIKEALPELAKQAGYKSPEEISQLLEEAKDDISQWVINHPSDNLSVIRSLLE